MNIPSIRQLIGVAGGVALLGGVVSSGSAQQGAIAGRVTHRVTQQPVAGAEVLVLGTNVASRSRQDGQYRIPGVAAGRYTLQVRLIGYATVSQPVSVTAGETAAVDFVLSEAAVPLEAVVVTATGAEQLKRELGHSVATIDATKPVEEAAPTNLADLLNARAPGVQVLPSGGTTGTGSRIRIRGSSSLSLSNEPIIFVDGIRVENGATGQTATSIGVGGQTPSRLNDLSPDDIESIEIVKGPSAAALYGTDASCTLTSQAAGKCSIDTLRTFNPLEVNSPFQTGSRQQYGVSASGGSEVTTFFLSGDFEREKGVYHPNDLRRTSLRANLHHTASRLLDIAVSTGYTSSNLGLPQNDNNSAGIASSGLLGSASGNTAKLGYGFLTPTQAFNIFVAQGVERFTGSVNANFRPTSFLTLRAVAGTDVTNRFDQQTISPGLVPLNQNTLDGQRNSNRAQIFNYTANFTATSSFRLSPIVSSNTAAGVQFFKDVFAQTLASGRKLVGGTTSLAGVVVPTVGENTDKFVTVGGYVEEQVGIHDRLYFTGALRGDDNSAFGANFNFITYPKLSCSWVVSEEPFFPRWSFLSSLRVRAAWGKSGRQPGPTDAVAFYSPVAVATNSTDAPGITDSSLGNPNLKPEKTREYETGFDADLWEHRLHFEFTYYDKNSRDALIARRLAPSLGVSTTRFENLGEVSNKGVEISLNAEVLNTPNLTCSVTASAWGNRNRLIDLGTGITPIIFGLGGATQRHQPGYPLGGYWGRSYTFNDANHDGIITASEVTVAAAGTYQGTPFPTHGGTLSTEIGFLKHFRLYGLLDGRFGNRLDNSTEQFRCLLGICRGR